MYKQTLKPIVLPRKRSRRSPWPLGGLDLSQRKGK